MQRPEGHFQEGEQVSESKRLRAGMPRSVVNLRDTPARQQERLKHENASAFLLAVPRIPSSGPGLLTSCGPSGISWVQARPSILHCQVPAQVSSAAAKADRPG